MCKVGEAGEVRTSTGVVSYSLSGVVSLCPERAPTIGSLVKCSIYDKEDLSLQMKVMQVFSVEVDELFEESHEWHQLTAKHCHTLLQHMELTFVVSKKRVLTWLLVSLFSMAGELD